jgi:RNA polymerase sigma factor (sigma-70 family)
MSSLNRCTGEAEGLLSAPSLDLSQPRSCSKNDGRRFAAVVLPYLADAYALARWLTRNHADSQDVVQDACVRALHGIGNFAGGDARSWVLTIVRRTAYDWLDKNRPAALVVTEDGDHPECAQLPEEGAGTAESWLIDREDEALFESAIAALPVPYRETIALRHLQGLTYREIAEVIGISIGTVMSRLCRARRHLIKGMNPTRLSSPARERNGTVGSRSTRVHRNSPGPSFNRSIGHAEQPAAAPVRARVHSEPLSTSFKHSIGHFGQRRASFGPQNPSEYAARMQSVPEGV